MAATIISQQSGHNLLDNAGIYVIESDLMGGASPPYSPTVENLTAHLELYEEQGANFVKIATAKSPYSSLDKQTKFVVQDLLDFDLNAGIPGTLGNGYWTRKDMIKKIKVKVADSHGSPPSVGTLVDGAEEIVIHGGTKSHKGPFTISGDNYVAHNYARQNAPRKRIHRSQPDWIYVFSKVSQRMEFTIKVYLDTGATWTATFATGAGYYDLFENRMNLIPSGWDMWDMDTKLADAMVSGIPYAYDQTLLFYGPGTGETVVDEVTVRYALDMRPKAWGDFLLHYNGMGGFETLWLSGKSEFGFDPVGDEFQRYNIPSSPSTPDYGETNRFTRQSREVNTGWQDAYAMDHLEQLFLGPCFLITSDSFLPVKFDKNNVKTRADDTGQFYNTRLTMKPQFRNRFYNML